MENHDYIIVGGRTAGLTVAARLTENPAITVLVIEAGPDTRTDPMVLTPGLFLGMYGNPKYDWNFHSVPQAALNNRVIANPRGRQLGGSSALNTMMMVYPSRKNIDTWSALGNEGWDFDSLKPYFDKSSTVQAPPKAAKDVIGLDYHDSSLVGDGPLKVSFFDGYTKSNSVWVDTFARFGLEVTKDVREGSVAMGAFQQPSSIDPETRTRSYAASAYLSDDIYKRSNLKVVTETVVKKILFELGGPEPHVRGVLCQSQGGSDITFESKQIILACGALQSPQILELSGIGSQKILERHGIPVIVDNPFVGENLQDHPIVPQSFELTSDVASMDVMRDPEVIQNAMRQYQADHSGPLSQSNFVNAFVPLADGTGVCANEKRIALFNNYKHHIEKQEDGEILRDLLDSGDEPTVQYLYMPCQINSMIARPSSMADYLTPTFPENYITIITILNHPFGRGSVHIKSSDINELPVWDPNFGVDPLDLELMACHVQFVERFITTEPFATLLKPNGARIPDIHGAQHNMDKAKEIALGAQASLFHPSGSCGMRPRDKGGVVDSRLRVYGVKGLRVVDASVFPLEPLGNIQSVVYAVAEKAADLIKEDDSRFR